MASTRRWGNPTVQGPQPVFTWLWASPAFSCCLTSNFRVSADANVVATETINEWCETISPKHEVARHSGLTPKLLLVKATLASIFSLFRSQQSVSHCLYLKSHHWAWSNFISTILSKARVGFTQSRQMAPPHKNGFFLGSGVLSPSHNVPARHLLSASPQDGWSGLKVNHAI